VIAFTLAFLIVTFLHVVVGELIRRESRSATPTASR